MKIHIPITKEKIKTHLAYAWWQYVLVVALSIFGWNLLYTTTHYRSPENKKVEWYCDSQRLTQTESADELMKTLHATLFSDMEEVTFVPVFLDDTYGNMQLTVWLSAGTGDVFTLEKTFFEMMGGGGGLLDLTPYLESGALNAEGLDVSAGRVIDPDTGKSIQAGIPMEHLPGLTRYGIACENEFLALSAVGGNVENALKLLNWLLQNMR